MHPQAFVFAKAALKQMRLEQPVVVEIGARDINGSVRQLLWRARSYVGVDVAPGHSVDVVANGATFAPLEAPDLVVSTETLEHTDQACAIVGNAALMLRPGGRLLVTCATDPRAPHSGTDGGPLREGEFYRNVARDDLVGWVEQAGLQVLTCEAHPDRGDLYLVAAAA